MKSENSVDITNSNRTFFFQLVISHKARDLTNPQGRTSEVISVKINRYGQTNHSYHATK